MSRTLTRLIHPPVAVAADAGSAAHSILVAAATRLLTWRRRARQRAALADLTDHMLADIGITRAQAMGEASKPFWAP